MRSETIFITGSTDGVGRVVALQLARSGARVVLHGRDATRGEALSAEIRGETGRAAPFYRADLASLAAVEDLARRVAADHPRLDVLINNAGIGSGAPGDRGRQLSADGYELRFAVNYLAHFLLSARLLPNLLAATPARIVNVASIGQQAIDFDDVMLERDFDGNRAYRQSKLAQILSTIDLAERLRERRITVNSLHPATFMNTTMVKLTGRPPQSRVEDGADAIAHLASFPDLAERSGLFFNGKREMRADAQAYDAKARARLFELSLRMVGLSADPF